MTTRRQDDQRWKKNDHKERFQAVFLAYVGGVEGGLFMSVPRGPLSHNPSMVAWQHLIKYPHGGHIDYYRDTCLV